jgi:hypothetical protein
MPLNYLTKIKLTGYFLLPILLMGCHSMDIKTYADNKPELTVQNYFTGKLQAQGMVQNWSGMVTRRFQVAMEGTWQGNNGTLSEHFLYDDGKEQNRLWHWQLIDAHHFVGKADDVIGEAQGEQYGNVIHMRYTLKVPVGNKTYKLDFDDWLYRIDEHTVLNKATMKKFGITVGHLTVSFNK